MSQEILLKHTDKKSQSELREHIDQIQIWELDSYIQDVGDLSIDFIRQFEQKWNKDDGYWESIFWMNEHFSFKQLEQLQDRPHFEDHFNYRQPLKEYEQKYKEKFINYEEPIIIELDI